ncbi:MULTISPECIES: hypothetical protein [Chitinophagaceae]|uniref:hypothetical protein n=1 Tax=Chitinophagaceae TaxID=563835 RepID=UPI000DF01978|nr:MULTISPECIES: hypothetical protein [Chitinophagaceae]RPD48230.1 hypothetical protein DRJ53_10815 [Paracnuella aquatica]
MNQPMTPLQSLELIEAMIAKTKSNMHENRIYFLFWGWLAFAAILGQFILKAIFEYRYHYLVWTITIPAIVITIIYTNKHRHKSARTFIGESMSNLWTGMCFSFFILSVIITSSPAGWMNSYPFFILLYGLGTFVSGRILRFKPMVLGGIANWVLAAICPWLPYDYQMLLTAVALLLSYIIPGHLLKNENAHVRPAH